MKKRIKFIDLFAGIGGFHKALEIATRKLDYDIECVFVSEIDKEAIRTYSSNFDYKNKIMDIKDLDSQSSQVPNHNFLLAGFPCQAFSNAGKKEGFLDKLRGTFFFDIAKILKNKKPKYILLENVKHLVNHNNGKTWETIIETLDKKLGYHIPSDPLILSPEEFGIPQSRKRVFIPGILKSATKKEVDFSDLKNQILNSIQKKKMNRNTIRNKFLEKKVNSKYYLKKPRK